MRFLYKPISLACFITFLLSVCSGPLSAQLQLEYSTYLGGEVEDRAYGIAVDSVYCVYVTGYTRSSSFPTNNPYQTGYAGDDKDALVAKLSSSGSSLIYSTYLGGENRDEGYSVCVGTDNCAYVTGYTSSVDFPTKNSYQPNPKGSAFVTKISSSGSSLVFSSSLKGTIMGRFRLWYHCG